MTRFKRYVKGLATGYLVLGANVLYTLVSVPLALHFLRKEEFGLWALLIQLMGYLMLVDLGMSSALARLLVDLKDQRNGGTYGGMILTGGLVALAQGGIVLMAGVAGATGFALLLEIPSDMQAAFVTLVRWQAVIVAFSLATRVIGHLLHAHQRLDVVNYGQLAALAVNLLVLWLGLRSGGGVFSVLYSNAAASLVNFISLLWGCCRQKLFPDPDCWGRSSWAQFKDLFQYGKDVFLVALGTQLLMASQALIITRTMGLEAAAVWSVGTKMFGLALQVIWRIFDISAPAFSEMIVRGEIARLRERYKALMILSASLAGVAAVSLVLCNSPFVSVWTAGRIQWSPELDVLLGVWLVIQTLVHCHNGFVLLTKEVAAMRYVYFLEGAVFVGVALWLAPSGGFTAILWGLVVTNALLGGVYGVARVRACFDYSWVEVAARWQAPMARVVCGLALAGGVVWWQTQALPDLARVVVHGLVCLLVGVILFSRFGVPQSLQTELVRRLPVRLQPVWKRVAGGSQSSP